MAGSGSSVCGVAAESLRSRHVPLGNFRGNHSQGKEQCGVGTGSEPGISVSECGGAKLATPAQTRRPVPGGGPAEFPLLRLECNTGFPARVSTSLEPTPGTHTSHFRAGPRANGSSIGAHGEFLIYGSLGCVGLLLSASVRRNGTRIFDIRPVLPRLTARFSDSPDVLLAMSTHPDVFVQSEAASQHLTRLSELATKTFIRSFHGVARLLRTLMSQDGDDSAC